MPIVAAVPKLPANDIGTTIEWFVTRLGFTEVFRYDGYASVERDGAELHLFQMAIDPKKTDFMVYLRVTGIDALYAEMQPRGVIHPNGALGEKPWGMREFSVLDPNGTLLTFGEPVD